MSASASIAQEYYKVKDYWSEADKGKNWVLAVWVVEFQDVDIIDKFLEIEQSPLGSFEDIFFRFDTSFKGDQMLFEKGLWEEFKAWFDPAPKPELDMYAAMKNDGLLLEDYLPNTKLEPTITNLWKEMLRFKSCISGLENNNFCIYFPPTSLESPGLGFWFKNILKEGIPEGIRLVTIDFKEGRKVSLANFLNLGLVVEIYPKLDMMEAINNEMDKDCNSYDAIGIDAKYRKQIRTVLAVAAKQKQLDTEVDVLLSLARQMEDFSSFISALLIASQAYFIKKENSKSEQYADEAIENAQIAMDKNDPAGYPIWKSCMMLKGALLMGKKKRLEAIVIYEKLAETAASQGDAFSAMEGYRLSGHLHYELNRLNTAFELLLLSLAAGSYLEMAVRRQSTFLHAAYLALYIGRQVKSPNDMGILKNELKAWLGDDWKNLLEEEGVLGAKQKRQKSFLEFN